MVLHEKAGDQFGSFGDCCIGRVNPTVLAETTFNPATATREFSVCLTDMGGLVFLPPLLSRLRELAPKATLRSRPSLPHELPAALESGEFDIAIGYFPDLPGSLLQQRLYERNYVCAFRHDHPRIGRRLSLAQYVELDHAAVHTPVRVHELVDRMLARHRLSRKVVLSVPYYIVIPPILEQTDLVATVPAEIGVVFSRFVKIRMLPLPIRIPNVVLRQYWHPRYQLDAANKWLRGVVNDLFAERGGSRSTGTARV
jgi:DNA-binding transcriptional LysR family regulator